MTRPLRATEEEDSPFKFTYVSISVPTELLERIDADAKADSRKRSNFIVLLLKEAYAARDEDLNPAVRKAKQVLRRR